ncbi:MAG: alpha/beta hydrolase [Crocinitomicaceae bacterium]|nr:alpha/beta hydrolase [Crocinitomicaceae bacterium]
MSSLLPVNVVRIAGRHRAWRWGTLDIHYYEFSSNQGKHGVYARLKGKPKLIFLHGYGGSALVQWFDVAKIMIEDYDVIIPDLLCSGGSEISDGDYSIESQVRHLKFILEQLNVEEKVMLCGNSYGGVVAAFFADQYPDMVSRLVLYDAPLTHYSIAYADEVARSRGMKGIRELLSPVGPNEMKIGLGIIYHKVPYFPDFVYRQMFEVPMTGIRDEQLKLLDYVIAHEDYYRSRKFSFHCPVYLIWGEFDALVPLSTAYGIMKDHNIPENHLVIIPNAAHAANMEYPRLFVKIIREMIGK